MKTVCADHKPTGHRDNLPAWCDNCGLTQHYKIPLKTDGEEVDMADNIKGIPFSSADEGIDFLDKAKRLVRRQYNEAGIGTPRGEEIIPLHENETYVVWFTFILGNWKAIISTSRPDGRIYEVTYNKIRDEAYVDTYLKTHNTVWMD